MTKLVCTVLLSTAVVAGADTAARAATCTELSATDLEIQLADGEDVTIRINAGNLRVDQMVCASAAVVWDITVLGGAGNESVTLSQVGGTLHPYDWNISLGGGVDGFTLQGGTGRERFGFATRAGDHIAKFDTNIARIPIIINFDVEVFTGRGGANSDTIRGQINTMFFTRRLNVYGEAGNDLLSGGSNNDVLNGGDGNDQLQGRAGNDSLRGGAGTDNMQGEDGNDSLEGQGGTDTENGGNGNDTFDQGNAASGNDNLNGAAGIDTVSYSGRAVSLLVDLLGGQANIGAETDTLVGIENANGGGGNDTLIGTDLKNRLEGGGGDDTLEGGLARDVLDCGPGNDSWTDADSLADLSCETQLP